MPTTTAVREDVVIADPRTTPDKVYTKGAITREQNRRAGKNNAKYPGGVIGSKLTKPHFEALLAGHTIVITMADGSERNIAVK